MKPVSEPTKNRPYTDYYSKDGKQVLRKYNYPGGREALIKRAIDCRGFTKEEAEKQYPEIISDFKDSI